MKNKYFISNDIILVETKSIKFGTNYVVFDYVDLEMLEELPNTICVSNAGYAIMNVEKKDQYLHRVINNLNNAKVVVDHINGDKLDNRRSNLRVATQNENMKNTRMFCTNKSGYRGVSYCKYYKKYRSYIDINGKRKHIGYYSNIFEAALAYDSTARANGFSRFNFPLANELSFSVEV